MCLCNLLNMSKGVFYKIRGEIINFKQKCGFIRAWINLTVAVSHWIETMGNKSSPCGASCFLPSSQIFLKSFDEVLPESRLPSFLMPAFKKWSLAGSRTYWVIKPLNNALRDSHRADAICWLHKRPLSVLHHNVFDWNEKGSTPDAVWLQGIGGWRPIWIQFLSVGERMENKFSRKLFTITVIQINKIFNYSSIQWLALPFVQMSLWAHGCSAIPSNSCDVLTESDLVYHYSSRTLHWKGLSAFQRQHEEIWFKLSQEHQNKGLQSS